jgi:hypothetical protein
MRAEEFSEILWQRPFVPLRIHLTDGTTYEIRHPEMIIVSRSRIDIGIPAEPSKRIAERIDHFSLLHVVRVEELSGTPSPPNN